MNNQDADLRQGGNAYIAWKDWQQTAFGTVSRKDATYYVSELKAAGISIDGGSAVLEIGFGNGSFFGWVRQKSARYVGTEANPVLLERARQAGVEVYPATLDIGQIAAGRKFDLIAIFDVLEHLEVGDIVKLLRSCGRCLAPGGRVLLRVPSGDSPFSAPLFYGDITHKTLLGSKAIVQLATLVEMDVTAVRDQAFPVLGAGLPMALRRSVVVLARALIGRLINAVFNGNERMVTGLNLVAILSNPGKHATAAIRDKA